MKRILWLLPIAAIIAGTLTNYWYSSSTSSRIATVDKVDYPFLASIQVLTSDFDGIQEQFKNAVGASEKKMLDIAADKATAFRKETTRMAGIAGASSAAGEISRAFEQYYTTTDNAASIMIGVKPGDVGEAVPAMQAAQKNLEDLLTSTRERAHERIEASIQASHVDIRHGLIANLIGSALILLVSLSVARLSIMNVMKALGGTPQYAKDIVHSVARGNLRTTIALRGNDTSSLLFAMRGMQTEFGSIIAGVRTTISSVHAAAEEIASGSRDLAQRTERQAESLKPTAVAIGELASTVGRTARNALRADELATNASAVAGAGGHSVGAVVSAMGEIDQSARRIVDIVAVIDSIAFQTNILALNAAVEAARAGAHGHGFAVVASEVRALAQRSATAAKEIKSLIATSAEKAAAGSRQAQEAGETMNEIVASVQRVSTIIAEISTASAEQSARIGQINGVVSELDEVTQQNAELVQEAATAAALLAHLAENVAQAISVFELGDTVSERQSRAVEPRTPTPRPTEPTTRSVARPGANGRHPPTSYSPVSHSNRGLLQ